MLCCYASVLLQLFWNAIICGATEVTSITSPLYAVFLSSVLCFTLSASGCPGILLYLFLALFWWSLMCINQIEVCWVSVMTALTKTDQSSDWCVAFSFCRLQRTAEKQKSPQRETEECNKGRVRGMQRGNERQGEREEDERRKEASQQFCLC